MSEKDPLKPLKDVELEYISLKSIPSVPYKLVWKVSKLFYLKKLLKKLISLSPPPETKISSWLNIWLK